MYWFTQVSVNLYTFIFEINLLIFNTFAFCILKQVNKESKQDEKISERGVKIHKNQFKNPKNYWFTQVSLHL